MTGSTYEGIVVLGAPRSGTTLIRRLLNAHPRIVCPPETNLLSACARFLDEQPSAHGLQIGVLSGLAFAGFPETTVLERLRDLTFGFYREMARAAKKPRWAEKTAFDIFHLEAIQKLLGDSCRFICVMRHGLDAACSMKELSDEMDRYMPELHEYVRRCSSPLEAMAHAWVDANAKLLDFTERHAEACVTVRYEDLIATPMPTLERVFAFLEEPTDVPCLVRTAFDGGTEVGLGDWKTYATTGFDSRSVGRGRSLPPDVVTRLAAILNPTLVQLGYDALPMTPAASRDESRQRYRVMKLVRQMKGGDGLKA